MTDWISDLCDHVGIGTDYRGFDGQTVHVSQDTRIAVLRAMGIDVASNDQAQELLEQMRREIDLCPAPYEVIVRAGKPATIEISRPVDWQLEAEETGTVLATGVAADRIDLPALPLGIHRLILSGKDTDHVTWILARPGKAVQLGDRVEGSRAWGVTAALYGLTDAGRSGIGTYEILGEYAAAIAGHGADFLGINPIHAMGQTRPDDVISPYSPSHRGFLNTWHVALPDPENCPDHTAQSKVGLIDYRTVLAANERAIAAAFAHAEKLPEGAVALDDFVSFSRDGGRPLNDYALFEELAGRFGANWCDWPVAYRDRHREALDAFGRENSAAIDRHKWTQWTADRQLQQAQEKALHSGMRIGLYLDLAVGPRKGGAETWFEASPLVTKATLGAPPDPLCQAGQKWGLAPLSPILCRKQGYAGFSKLLRAVMRHAGMIRIDHVLGLMRSFWLPDGADQGAYVAYPFEALLAVVAIESARSGTIVIGEDLGLVPAGLREKLAASGIYGLDVLQYQRSDQGGFADTANNRSRAICAFGTHDTPTINGFFAAEDAKLQCAIGFVDPAALDDIEKDRRVARQSLGDGAAVCEIHSRLARSASEIVAIQLDDMAGTDRQQNLPGTIDEYPNWRQITPFSISEISQSQDFARLGLEMREHGRGQPETKEREDDFSDHPDIAH